ncbi:general odorant-binding protein 19d [Bactrocera dorsalis]|uniref:General odorant-binding protein 19d n=1 Tax=Bactrocera dorsalis TaxID=27457 RepID=A0A9B2H538_BACDO|nr:general odorant-binding protein 19d [Bactrocera dorsalis]
MKCFVVFLAICSFAISFSEADEFGEKVKKIAEECKGQVGASDDDVARLFKYEPAANDKAKCLTACTMKKLGTMDENNKVVEAGAIAYIKQLSGGDAEFEKLSLETYNECKSTPESSNECEYAEAFRQCVLESAKSKGLKILPQV